MIHVSAKIFLAVLLKCQLNLNVINDNLACCKLIFIKIPKFKCSFLSLRRIYKDTPI